jgi:hypothetical protein
MDLNGPYQWEQLDQKEYEQKPEFSWADFKGRVRDAVK